MSYLNVKQVKIVSDINELNQLLACGEWKIADSGYNQEGIKLYEMHKVK